MTGPFDLRRPPAGVAPIALVCDSPHSGTRYPADFGHAIERAALRRSEDTHVERLWESAPAFGAALLTANFPRSYIDCNRAEDDIDLAMIEEGGWPQPVAPSPRTLALGIGLLWRETPERRPIYARRLTGAQVSARIETCWRPYRQALAQELAAAWDRHGTCWHLNLHSMPSNAYERLALPAPRRLADVVLGDRHGTSCEPAFRDAVAEAFRAQGCTVAVNDPYEGAELVRVHGAPAQRRHSLQIEINRALYMDEATREPGAGFAHLKCCIDRVLAAVAEHVAARTVAAA